MKKLILIFTVILGFTVQLAAQELVVNGTFDDGLEGWTHFSKLDGGVEGEIEVVEDEYGPEGGEGAYLWMTCAGATYFNQCLWQTVTVQVGDTLYPNGAFRDLTEGNLVNYWCEIFLGTTVPDESADYTDNTLLAFNTWTGCGPNNNGTFLDQACVNNLTDSLYFIVPDSLGEGDVTMYFILKTGIWTDGTAGELSYEISIDNLSLVKGGNINPSAVENKSIESLVDFALYSNYPNPFNPTTTINFSLARTSETSLTIFDVNGRVVRTLIHGTMPSGFHTVQWNATDDAGKIVPSGVYFCQLKSGQYSKTQRMVLTK